MKKLLSWRNSAGSGQGVLLLFFFAWFGLMPAVGQTAADDSGMTKLQASFERAMERVDQPLAALNRSYVAALERLLAVRSKAGDLDGAIQVKAELDGFGSGSSFNADRFAARATENVLLENTRSTFLGERARVENEILPERNKLADKYRESMLRLEAQQTKQGELQAALAIRAVREALDSDRRLKESVPGGGTAAELAFEGRMVFNGKGEFEVRLNGEKLSFRNSSEIRDKYLYGVSRPQSFKPGDVIWIRMRTPHVFRSFAFGIESDDGTISVPVTRNDYRISTSDDPDDLDAATFLSLKAVVDAGSADPEQIRNWNTADELLPSTRDRIEWVKVGSGDDWKHCAVLLRPEMFVKNDK